MPLTSRPQLLVGLAAVAAALGTAATLGATTARADAIADILDNVQGSLTTGQTALTDSATDFASGVSGFPAGLEAFDSFLNNDLVATEEDLLEGSLNALAGDPVGSGHLFGEPAAPADIADALSFSQVVITYGQTELADVSTALAAGDYAGAAHDLIDGTFSVYDFPAEQFVIGAFDQWSGI